MPKPVKQRAEPADQAEFTIAPAFTERAAWNAIGEGWRHLHGSVRGAGVSFEWHDFKTRVSRGSSGFSLAIKGFIHDCGHCRQIQGEIQKILHARGNGCGVGQAVRVRHAQDGQFATLQNFAHARQLLFIDSAQFVRRKGGAGPSIAFQHGFLRRKDLIERTLHEDNAAIVFRRQKRQQLSDKFERAAFGVRQP